MTNKELDSIEARWKKLLGDDEWPGMEQHTVEMAAMAQFSRYVIPSLIKAIKEERGIKDNIEPKKAILELEMPETCHGCPIVVGITDKEGNTMGVCAYTKKCIMGEKSRLRDCPLKIIQKRRWKAECKKCGRQYDNWYAFMYCGGCGELLEGTFYNVEESNLEGCYRIH